MAVRLPEFEKTTKIQPGPVTSFAPSFEAEEKTFGSLEDVVGKNLQRKVDSQAIAQGSLAGDQPGFKPAEGGGRATRLYNAAALQANRYTLAASSANKAASLTDELSQNIDGNKTLDEYRARYNEYAQTVLANTPDQNRAYAKNLMQSHANSGLRKLQSMVNKQNNAMAFVSFNDNHQQLSNVMQNSARNGSGEEALTYYTLANDQINDGLKAGFLSPEQAVLSKKELDKGLNENRLMYKYEQSLNADRLAIARGNKAGTSSHFRTHLANSKSYDSIFSPEDKAKLNQQFDKLDKQQAIKDGLTEQTYTNKVNEIVNESRGGVSPNTADLFDIQSLKPNDFAEVQNKINDGLLEHSTIQNFRSAGVKGINEGLEWANRPLTDQELKSGKSVRIQNIKKNVLAAMQQDQKLIKEDPVEYVTRRDDFRNDAEQDVQRAEDNLRARPGFDALPQEEQEIQIQRAKNTALQDTMIKYQKQMGISENKIRGLNNEELNNAVIDIQNLPLDQQPAAVQQYLDNSSPESQRYVQQDLQSKLPQSTQYTMKINNSPDAKQYTADAAIAWTRKLSDYKEVFSSHGISEKELADAVNTNNTAQKYSEVLSLMQGDSVTAQHDFLTKAQLLAAQLLSKNGSSFSDAIDNSVNAMISDIQFTKYKGNQIFIPKDADSSVARHMMNYLEDTALNDPELEVNDQVSQSLPANVRDFSAKPLMISNSYFALTSDQRKLRLVDQYGTPIKNSQGKEYTIDFQSELMNPESDLARNANEFRLQQGEEFIRKVKFEPKKASEILSKNLQDIVNRNEELYGRQ